jgi:hypothetical protein
MEARLTCASVRRESKESNSARLEVVRSSRGYSTNMGTAVLYSSSAIDLGAKCPSTSRIAWATDRKPAAKGHESSEKDGPEASDPAGAANSQEDQDRRPGSNKRSLKPGLY